MVSFGKGTVLGRERFEHNLRQVGDIALVVLGLTVSFDLIGQLNSFLASSLDRRGYGRLVALVVAGFVDQFRLTLRIFKAVTFVISLPVTLRSLWIQMFRGWV